MVAQQHQFHVPRELGLWTPERAPQNSSEGQLCEGRSIGPILPGPADARTLTVLAPVSGFWYRARA
jgi:hypothetical protein